MRTHPSPKHTHIRATLDDGRELRFDDARRFGRVAYGSREALTEARVLPRLGVEPLSDAFSQERLDAVLRTTTRTVKAALLDQKGVAGLGNIYIDEACFLAGVRPTQRCHRLTRKERAALLDAIRRVLTAAVANRGSSVDDYRDVWNARGSNQERLQVYGRGGQPCFTCGATAEPHRHCGTDDGVLRELPAMTRVTIASYDDDPPLGGQGVVVHGMRAALERRGVQVHTISGRGEHAIADRAPHGSRAARSSRCSSTATRRS